MPTLTLESTVYTLQQLLDVPEAQVALAGRSNVGKSSLINALAVRKNECEANRTLSVLWCYMEFPKDNNIFT